MENAQKECTTVVGKDNSSQVPFSLHAVGHMIRFLLPVAGDVERHNFYAAALDDAVYASLCLTLEHDKGLVLKSLHSTWDLRSRSWQGMVSHFWIAVAMQGCWTLGNTPKHFDITEYESTLEAKLLCCTPWYSISCDASCGTWRVAAGVSSHILLAPDVDQWSEKWVNFTPRLGSSGRGLATDEGGLLRVGPPALWYLWLWILFYLGKGPGTQWHRRGSKQQHCDNNNEHFRIMQCDFDRFWDIFWFDTETQVLVGDPREMLAAQACSDYFFTPFGGTRLRFENLLPFGRADIVVVDPPGLVTNNAEPLYTDSCLINERYTVARHEPFRHSSINSKGIDSGFGDVCWSWKKQDEMSRTVLRLLCFFSMLVGSHNKLVVIGTWYCSPKPGLLGSGPCGKSQTQLEKLPAKPVRSDQFFPMNIFLL